MYVRVYLYIYNINTTTTTTPQYYSVFKHKIIHYNSFVVYLMRLDLSIDIYIYISKLNSANNDGSHDLYQINTLTIYISYGLYIRMRFFIILSNSMIIEYKCSL